MFERRYFIIAPNFHGTTLLSKLLNDHPEVVSLGDTYPSNRFDQVCGCGEYVSRCVFWQRVGERVDAERHRAHPHLLPVYPAIAGDNLDRILYSSLPLQLLRTVMAERAREEFARDFKSFESAVHDNVGRPAASVFVDGVKSISRVYALMASGVRVDGVIHLQRDPGDYIQSTMKQKGQSWRVFLPRLINYRLFHLLARRVGGQVPYLAVTYEGLADQTDKAVATVFDFLRVPRWDVSALLERSRDGPWHFMGNASLLQFEGSIRRSRHKQAQRERVVTRLLAGRYDAQRQHLKKFPV